MEDEERQKKLEAGKAKLAEYRQRKAYADSQKKQKKKKKKKSAEDSEGDSQERGEVEPQHGVGGEESSGGGRDGSQEGNKDAPSSEFTFTRMLQSGETVEHHQNYSVEAESEVSTTAEDCSSEVNGCLDEVTENLMMSSKDFIWDEVEPLQQLKKAGAIQDMEKALAEKTKVVEELTEELEDIRATFGTEGVQQLQDFEAALKQRDGIITQLTANLQQAREEKDEIMKEFLELTEQSQKLQIQFQQLQAGETLRNTSHSSTAADLFQARQQLSLYQQQVDEMNAELDKHQESSSEQLENIKQLQNKLTETETAGRKAEEFFRQRINEKDRLIAEQEKVILGQEQSLTQLRIAEDSFAQTLKEKTQLISEQKAIIKEQEAQKHLTHQSDEKDLIIAEHERVISARECSITGLEDELERSKKCLHELQQQMAAKETHLGKCLLELESSKSELEECKTQIESSKLEREKERSEFGTCKAELAASKQKERMSSNEIMQLMGTIEDLQKRVHQGNLSESDAIQKMQEDTGRKLEVLRAELDEMYGQQIVQMKQELNLQHAARVEQMATQHHAELELLKESQRSQTSAATAVEMDVLNVKIQELQFLLEESQAICHETKHELIQVTEEKTNLQVKVEALLQDSAKAKVEQVSNRVATQESHHTELRHLQEIIENLKEELALAREEAQEMEAKHDSEITNYKIKLEMLEREKDAVLDRMAESQEAELDRLRTQLLFSHEEELSSLREALQRENFLNTENLLNEAAVKHERTTDELRVGYEEKLHLLEAEKAGCVMERDELLHQILELKEDLKIALHSSKADELVQQLQELQVELVELRKRGAKQTQMESEVQQLVKKTEMLEIKSREKEESWENKWREQEVEKGTLTESNHNLKEELVTKNQTIETLEAENIQIHQQVAELTEEIKKQRTTFSFAEKNFEVNYQELKEEYTCLIEAKTQLEERSLKETLEFEAKIARLQSQIQEECSTKTEEKHTTELMEKLSVTLNEKESLVGRISEVTEQLMLTESRVKELEEQLLRAREETAAAITQNESLGKTLEGTQEIKKQGAAEPLCSAEEHHLQIQSLQEEIKALQSLLQATESERDDIQQALELQRLALTPSPVAAAAPTEEGPVEGRSSPRKSTATGSNRRKRRQRSKQERRLATAVSDCREKQKTWEEEDEEEEQAAAEEERATSAAELRMQPQMESQVMSRSQETDSREDSTDGYQGDGDSINRAVRKHVFGHDVQEGENRADHGECRLQMEAQRLSLSQIHAAQFELLQEETEALTHSLELKLQQQSGRGDPAGPKLLQSINVSQVVQKECTEIIKSFQKIFGEKLLESIEVEEWKPPLKREDTSDSPSVLREARELYGDLQQLKETIEQEHFRLSQLQSLLRDDGSKIIELQTAYDDLKSSSEQQISALRGQVAGLSSSSSKDVEEQTVTPSACISEELQRLRAEEQVKQLQLEESHREEVECLRAHYQQQATETEERYLTELLMLQQQLQDVTRAQAHSRATESGREWSEAHSEELQKKPGEEESEEGVDLRSPVGSVGLAAQLQALRTTLHQKYVQEVAALTEQHNRELRRVREEKELDRKREKEEDFNDTHRSGRSEEVSTAAGQNVHGKKQDWERTEEEVAKAIVQMSVQFAQQTELVRLNKRSCQRSSSMQTVQSGPEQMEETGNEEQTPRASPSLSSWLEEVERLKTELEERNIVIGTLKKELQKIQSGPEQKRENGQEEDLEEGESERLERTQEDGGKLRRDPGEAPDRNILLKTNENLSQVLLEVLKTTAAAEETLSLHMQSLAASSGSTPPSHASECHQSSEPSTEDADSWSREMEADKSLKMSHQTIDSLLLGVGTRLDSEDYLMGISSRLQTALEKMLMVITDTTNQLEHARLTQTELMRESFRHNQEMNELLQKQEELQERLTEEARAREQLALELHRAEDLIDGYTGERAALEEQLHQKEELHLSLEQELQVTSSRLHELEQERLQMQEERELLSRQQDAMREHAGPRELRLVEAAMVAAPEADLLEETEKLMKEKVEVQRQAEKENTDLLKHNKILEAELEEQVSRVFELEQTQMMERRDLQQQIQALEKQLEKNRKFLDEQAVDREHERDFFQQEIQKLEQQLKVQQKQQPGSEHRNQEVDRLTSQLKEKADWCSELLLSSEQLRRELQERDEEIDKLESRIRELEQALLTSAESLEKNQHATITETKQTTLESQLQTEREALERKEKEICNLEEQLEQFREELENKSEEVQQLQMQLEIQRKEISSQQEYLETRDSLLQVMEAKDREITLLNEQITKLQHMETTSDNKELDDREELIKELESRVECLRGEQERLKRNNEEEVDQLNAVIDKLQQELSNIEQKQVSEEDEDTGAEQESAAWALDKEEYDQMKQSMDLATKELTKLKTEHTRLLKNYLCLKESAKALAETEQPQSPDPELEDALIQKTACLVVMQAQVQALEQSATSRLEELGLRVQELEEALNEKEGELQHCRLQLEQAEGHAEDWQQKASELEVKLGDKGDEVNEGSQEMEARLGHVEPRLMANVDPHRYDFGIPKMDFREIGQLRQASTGKVFHLTQRLQELEVGLSGIQKDQELQKQLLSSSEEEVLEYERRLSVLMDLLRQMKSRTHQRASAAAEASSSDDPRSPAEVQQELQEVRAEVLVTKEELVSYKDTCGRLTEELQEKNGTIQKLKDQLDKVDESRVSELGGELTEAQSEAAAAKEELSSCRERLEKLQELLQEREMTIAHLSGELCQLKAEEDRDDKTDLLLENRNDPFSTKEEFESYRKHNEKLEEDLQLRDISITKLTEELLEKKEKVDATKELLDSHRQHKEKLQEEVRLRDISITKLTEELQEMKEKLDTIQDLRQHKEKLHEELHDVSVFKLKEELQEMKEKVDATKEELDSNRQHNEQLQEEVRLRDVSIFKLKEELQEMEDKLDTANVELDSNRQHKEKLQEEVHLRDLSISKLEEEIQELKAKLDTTQELDSNRQHKEKLQEELHDVSVFKLKEELQEMKEKVDATKEELDSNRQHNEQLQEEVQLRDVSIFKLKEELQEMEDKLDTANVELDSNRQHKEKLQEEVHLRDLSISKLEEEIQELKAKLDTTQELDSNRQHKEKLQEEVHLRDLSISKLEEEIQELKAKLDTTQELDSNRQHKEKLQEEVHLRDLSISKLEEEIQELKAKLDTTQELDSNRQHKEKLQEEVHLRDLSIAKLKEELQKLRENLDTTEEEFSSFKQHQGKLHQDLQVCEGSMSKLEEELQEKRKNLETTEKELSIYRQHNEKLQEELQVCKDSLSDLAEELQEMRHHLDTSQENLNSFRQHNEQLQEEAHVHELSISKLKEELQDAQKELVRAVDCVPPSPSPSPSPQPLSSASSSSTAQPKRKGVKQPSGKGSIVKDKPTLSRKTSNQTSGKSHSTRLNSRSERQSVAVTHSSTQTEPLRLSDLGPDSKTHTNDEMEEVLGEFREKIVQMQELHAAEILDMEARHISESESLRRDTQALEEECKALRAAIDKLRCPELRPGNVASQFNFSTVQASRPDRPASLFRDDYTSDSSSDYSQRTGFDIPSLQQELRTTPEGARRDPDDPLPDRIKTLLREVHQEGMQVLSLSELPISEGESGHVQGWVKERDDLLTTVESLRGLITQMQIKTSGNEDWRVQLLDAVRRVFLSERNVLRSALYSQLDTLDTSDAIIHLNRLEQRLAEQDAQHREAMDSLHLADRSSLMSEIHQLRGQLERVHHGESTGHGLIEKREGGGGDRAAESDRLLLEELKGELSQTKLELETTLKAQHKHLKEMDALRAEVSQKAAEVDALTDRLTEEKKRSRDLQWAAEKERCETDRKEESKREELEDLQLTLEDQKDRVAQLTVTLEQERQASARLSEQAERERLSLHRRLQELQVQLETEKAKALEMSTALGRERELRTGVSSRSGPSSELGEDTAGQEVDGSLLEKLQRELDDKHAQVVHLLSQLEVQKLEVVQKEEELTAGRRELRREQEALQVARAQLETLEAQISESQEQLGRELEKSKDLEEERERLEGKVHWFIEQSGAREDDVSLGDSTDRTKDWVFQQKSGNIQSPSASPAACGPWRTVDKILSKLYLISSRVSSMASKPTDRPTAEVEHEDLSWVQTNVEEVITMLQQCPGLPAVPESASLLPGGSSSTLTQRLLRQNAELTGFVSRLTEEKNDLRNQTLRLEEEIRRYRQAGTATGEGFNFRKGVSKSDSSGMLLSQEREAWTREKVRLEKALHQAQAQVARLHGEIRSDTLREMTGPEADNAALKRIYGKYLRSESFRKALIYQKKYLLLLLGGFQECEEATLSLLSRMGGQPALSTLESIHQRRRGLTRFRSAVRVSIALSRMRFLVKRWHKTTGISSATSGTVSKTGAGQTPGTDARDSPYLHPGSVEMYRERGGGGVSGGRGRSGRESPRSVASSTHHRFHLAGEHAGLTCSHLQSYDPDRALTDYISRLEALQRRLGSVTSGATSYAQLHFGLRR